jgi:hypothetical protein
MKLVRVIPLIPWWLLAKAFRFERCERDYDWSLSGMTRSPLRRSAIFLGWALWAFVAAGLLLVLAYKLESEEAG